MTAARIAILAAAALAAGAAAAQPPPGPDPVGVGWQAPDMGDSAWDGSVAPNAFFYPGGYDPQYGSAGRVPDAADFAAGYGCRPIWNAKTGRTMPSCN